MYRYIYIIYIYKQSWERDPGAHFRAAQAHLLTAPTSPHPKCPNSQTPHPFLKTLTQYSVALRPKLQRPKARIAKTVSQKPPRRQLCRRLWPLFGCCRSHRESNKNLKATACS